MRAALGLAALLLAGCSSDSTPIDTSPQPSTSGGFETGVSAPSSTIEAEPEPGPPPRVAPDDVRVATAMAAVEHLAGVIGPRPGSSPAYRQAADWVERQLTSYGWAVEQQRFPAPPGFSVAGPTAGLPVAGGPSANVVATRGDVRPGRPWLVVGAHLDTVPTSPGAEDNASGVGVLLAVAEALGSRHARPARRTRLPVVLVAFGAEEPRGPSDDDHHYGSRYYVASLTPAERRGLRGMVSLDRVGVGDVLPVGTPAEPNALTDDLQSAARRAGVETVLDPFQRSSDHWSFVRAGLPGARLGSTPYAEYHSPADLPPVVERAQLERAARTVIAWLR